MKNIIIPIIIIMCFSCTNVRKDKIAGHILLLHVGEENKPIPTFIFSTNRDTSYLIHKDVDVKNSEDGINIMLQAGENYVDSNIEDVSSIIYRQIKKTLLDYEANKREKYKGYEGSFRIFICDTEDSTNFIMPKSELAKKYLTKIIAIAEKNDLEKTEKRFVYYRDLQD